MQLCTYFNTIFTNSQILTNLEKRVDGILCLPVHLSFREHVEIRLEAIARPNVLNRGVNFARICARLLEVRHS